MNEFVEKVAEFHEIFVCGIGDGDFGDMKDFILRSNLIKEECQEFHVAVNEENALKELCDIVYVAVGTAVKFGWDIEEAFKRVHASNMSKAIGGVKYRGDGKVLKGPNYFPPDLGDLV